MYSVKCMSTSYLWLSGKEQNLPKERRGGGDFRCICLQVFARNVKFSAVNAVLQVCHFVKQQKDTVDNISVMFKKT